MIVKGKCQKQVLLGLKWAKYFAKNVHISSSEAAGRRGLHSVLRDDVALLLSCYSAPRKKSAQLLSYSSAKTALL
jgi:hypothetical protein